MREKSNDIGPGSRVFYCGQAPWGRGLVLKRAAPKGLFWVYWPAGWKKGRYCEDARTLTRDLSPR